MTDRPDLRELVGQEVPPDELARLQRVDQALRSIPPPPSIPPSLTASVLSLADRPRSWRRAPVAAALALAALAAAAFVLSSRVDGEEFSAVDTVILHATSATPQARMIIDVGPLDEAGNWPLLVTVSGLRSLPEGGYYELWLTRDGRLAASCGRFRVSGDGETRLRLNAPYRFKRFDRWVVIADVPSRGESEWLLQGRVSAPA